MKQLVMGLAVSALFLAGQALAQAPYPAVLVHADAGTVSVQGNAVAANSSAGANAGDTVAVTDGQATVTYSNGCEVKVTGAYQVLANAPVCTGAVSLVVMARSLPQAWARSRWSAWPPAAAVAAATIRPAPEFRAGHRQIQGPPRAAFCFRGGNRSSWL